MASAVDAALRMNRQTLLRRAGLVAGTVAVGGAGALSYRAYDQGVFQVGQGAAYEPWADWKQHRGLIPLVAAATLAPSPHNSQPWLFRIGSGQIDVFADASRDIGAIDPYGREQLRSRCGAGEPGPGSRSDRLRNNGLADAQRRAARACGADRPLPDDPTTLAPLGADRSATRIGTRFERVSLCPRARSQRWPRSPKLQRRASFGSQASRSGCT